MAEETWRIEFEELRESEFDRVSYSEYLREYEIIRKYHAEMTKKSVEGQAYKSVDGTELPSSDEADNDEAVDLEPIASEIVDSLDDGQASSPQNGNSSIFPAMPMNLYLSTTPTVKFVDCYHCGCDHFEDFESCTVGTEKNGAYEVFEEMPCTLKKNMGALEVFGEMPHQDQTEAHEPNSTNEAFVEMRTPEDITEMEVPSTDSAIALPSFKDIAPNPSDVAYHARAIGAVLVGVEEAKATINFISLHMPFTSSISNILNEKFTVSPSVRVACFGNILFGYHLGVINGALKFICRDPGITENIVPQGWVVSTLLARVTVGSFSGGTLADKFGQRRTFQVDASPLAVGAFLSATVHNAQKMLVGRLLAGIRIGISSAIVPLYIFEISPTKIHENIVFIEYAAKHIFELNLHDPYAVAYHAQEIGEELVVIEVELANANFVSVHMPLTSPTMKILNDEFIAKVWDPGTNLFSLLPNQSYSFSSTKNVELSVKISSTSLKIWVDDFVFKMVVVGNSLLENDAHSVEDGHFGYLTIPTLHDISSKRIWRFDKSVIWQKIGPDILDWNFLEKGKKFVFWSINLKALLVDRIELWDPGGITSNDVLLSLLVGEHARNYTIVTILDEHRWISKKFGNDSPYSMGLKVIFECEFITDMMSLKFSFCRRIIRLIEHFARKIFHDSLDKNISCEVASLLGFILVAKHLGFVSKQITFLTAPTVGGLLNTTFGNTKELIISISALESGMISFLQQSLIGSVLSNMMMILGCAFFSGGIKCYNKKQCFKMVWDPGGFHQVGYLFHWGNWFDWNGHIMYLCLVKALPKDFTNNYRTLAAFDIFPHLSICQLQGFMLHLIILLGSLNEILVRCLCIAEAVLNSQES